jgi:NodT family efflux transporter outer membrane factor (OMF) lipoprotein
MPLLALASAVLILAACAALPPAAPPRSARPASDYAADSLAAAPKADWPADAWWTAYGDAQLTTLVQEGLDGSPTLAEAAARVRQAAAVTAAAGARRLPSLSGNAAIREQKQSYNNGIPADFVPQGYNDTGRLTLDFGWELDFWGRNRAAVAAAASEGRAAAADAAEARLVLSTAIATAYADLARLYAERDVTERAIATRREIAGLVRSRVANGLDTRGEQSQAEAEQLQAEADLVGTDEQISLTRNRLAALLGAGPDRGLAIQRPGPAALHPLGLPPSLAADLVGRRPDLAAARWRAEAAASRIKEAKAAFYPNVDLIASLGVEALHLNLLFDHGSDIGSVGPAVSLPIFQGGRLRAQLRGAEADRDAAVASYDATLAEALRQVADAVTSQRQLAVQLDRSRAALAAAEDALRIARLRYQGGLSSYPSVLLAEQGVLQRRRQLADLEARGFALDVALVRALGGGYRDA